MVIAPHIWTLQLSFPIEDGAEGKKGAYNSFMLQL